MPAGKGAATLGSAHKCNKSDHVDAIVVKSWPSDKKTPAKDTPHQGQPIQPPCSSNVKIQNKPAARTGDYVACIGTPPLDLIVTGPKTVKINGRLAAFHTSKCFHDGSIDDDSSTVRYDQNEEGATFGDPTLATEACLEAARKRRDSLRNRDLWVSAKNNPDLSEDYKKDPEGAVARYLAKNPGMRPPAIATKQGYDNNCGHETARQLCIEKCKKGNQEACKHCNKTEEEWYKLYLAELQTEHNKTNGKKRAEVIKKNEETWEKAKKAGTYHPSSTSGDKSEKDASKHSWQEYEGQSINIGGTWYAIERVPSEANAAEVANPSGKVGSFQDTRYAMMKRFCGIDSLSGGNDTPWVAHDVAEGNRVVAVVDISAIHGGPVGDPPEMHAVTVTQMTFGPDGKLKSVKLNDTSLKGGCGKDYPGGAFEKALVRTDGKDGVLTNVVPP